MNKSQLRDARAFAEALFCTDGGTPPKARIDWLLEELQSFIEHAGTRAALILNGGFLAARWLAPPLIGKQPPLTRLSLEDRCRALEKLERTPAGLVLLAVKAMLSIIYYEHPDVLRECGVLGATESRVACTKEPS